MGLSAATGTLVARTGYTSSPWRRAAGSYLQGEGEQQWSQPTLVAAALHCWIGGDHLVQKQCCLIAQGTTKRLLPYDVVHHAAVAELSMAQGVVCQLGDID